MKTNIAMPEGPEQISRPADLPANDNRYVIEKQARRVSVIYWRNVDKDVKKYLTDEM